MYGAQLPGDNGPGRRRTRIGGSTPMQYGNTGSVQKKWAPETNGCTARAPRMAVTLDLLVLEVQRLVAQRRRLPHIGRLRPAAAGVPVAVVDRALERENRRPRCRSPRCSDPLCRSSWPSISSKPRCTTSPRRARFGVLAVTSGVISCSFRIRRCRVRRLASG